jgi:hypothetical protein
MKELNKLINKIMLWNLPCVVYMYCVLLYSKSFEMLMYRSNFVILCFGIVNLWLFISLLLKEHANNKLSIKKIVLAYLGSMIVVGAPVLYYAVSPLAMYRAINGADKNVNTVIFNKKQFPDLASEDFGTCNDELICSFHVVKFRVYPRHGTTVDLDISPIQENSSMIMTMPMRNIHIVFNQVILTKEKD